MKFNQNKRFSRAVGCATDLAVKLGYAMEDRTGRLSEAECAALVRVVDAELSGCTD